MSRGDRPSKQRQNGSYRMAGSGRDDPHRKELKYMADKKPSKSELKKKAQDIIVSHMAEVCASDEYESIVELCEGDEDLAQDILKGQMDRVARMFGYKEAWFG